MSDEITTEETTEAVEFEKAAGDQVQGAADRQGVKPGVSPVVNATGNPGTTDNVGNPNTHHASGYIGVGGVGQQNDGLEAGEINFAVTAAFDGVARQVLDTDVFELVIQQLFDMFACGLWIHL